MKEMFASKATPELIQDAFRRAEAKLPGRKPVVLWDGYGSIGEEAFIDCRGPLTAVDTHDIDASVFIYACTQDDIGTPFLRHVMKHGGRFYPIRAHQPCTFAHTDTVARRTLEVEHAHQRSEGFAKWDHGTGDFEGLIQALNICKGVAGAYVEIGCYRGSSGGAVLRYLQNRKWSRACHFIDVFDGFDYAEAKDSADVVWAGTHKTEGMEAIAGRLEAYASDGVTVDVHRANIITDTLPDFGPIAVANIDVDLYEAVLAALKQIAPRMARGGIIVVEDPGHSPYLVGARIALDEFMEENADFLPVMIGSGQTFLIRK